MAITDLALQIKDTANQAAVAMGIKPETKKDDPSWNGRLLGGSVGLAGGVTYALIKKTGFAKGALIALVAAGVGFGIGYFIDKK